MTERSYSDRDEFKVRTFSLRKKLFLAFFIIVSLMILLSASNYYLNNKIQSDSYALKNIEAPLNIMVEQVIGYDAMLTGAAHVSLLHAEKKEMLEIAEHKQDYDEIGAKLDNLLKFQAKELLEKSKRSKEDKEKIDYYLKELDRINIALVDLEVEAFSAMEKGDVEKARSLIVSENYHQLKRELADLYSKWAEVEAKVSEEYRARVLNNTRQVLIINAIIGILAVIAGIITAWIVSESLTRPIQKLTEATKEVERGNFKAKADIKTGDELEMLADSFNKTTAALERMDEEHKQIEKAKTEFLSITSHELRSPMTPMKAQLQMLEEGYFGKLNEKQLSAVQIVERNTTRLDKIIVDFLEISRIEAARLKFNFIKTSLNSHISALITEMKGFMPEKRIEIVSDIKKLPVIEVDPDRAMQVLRNLINNAIKFSKDNSKVFVKAEQKGDFILFSVKDNGVGISKQDQIKLFEPFFQVGGMYQRKVGGTGLGLAICRGIVESQHGRIWVESEIDKGATFYFTVPLEPVKEMKPIRILFSNANVIEKDAKELFLKHLGPLGETEFNDQKIKGLFEKSLIEYVNELNSKGIIKEKEEFIKEIHQLFGLSEKGISDKDISKFVKKRSKEVSEKDISSFIKKEGKNEEN